MITINTGIAHPVPAAHTDPTNIANQSSASAVAYNSANVALFWTIFDDSTFTEGGGSFAAIVFDDTEDDYVPKITDRPGDRRMFVQTFTFLGWGGHSQSSGSAARKRPRFRSHTFGWDSYLRLA